MNPGILTLAPSSALFDGVLQALRGRGPRLPEGSRESAAVPRHMRALAFGNQLFPVELAHLVGREAASTTAVAGMRNRVRIAMTSSSLYTLIVRPSASEVRYARQAGIRPIKRPAPMTAPSSES